MVGHLRHFCGRAMFQVRHEIRELVAVAYDAVRAGREVMKDEMRRGYCELGGGGKS